MSNLDPIVDKIVIARVGLLLRHPFFGNMATRLKIVEASEWCATAATDGRHLYYSKDFFQDLTVKQVEFVVAHEILHNVFEHMLRVLTVLLYVTRSAKFPLRSKFSTIPNTTVKALNKSMTKFTTTWMSKN